MTPDSDIRRLFEAAVAEAPSSGDLLEAPMARLRRARRRDRLIRSVGGAVLAAGAAALYITMTPSGSPSFAGSVGGAASGPGLADPRGPLSTPYGYEVSVATSLGPAFAVTARGTLVFRAAAPQAITASQELAVAKGATRGGLLLTVSVTPQSSQPGWSACTDLGLPPSLCSRTVTRGAVVYTYAVDGGTRVRVVSHGISVDAQPLPPGALLTPAQLVDVLLSADVARQTAAIGTALVVSANPATASPTPSFGDALHSGGSPSAGQ